MGARHSRATFWTSQVLLAGVSGVFPGVLPFNFAPLTDPFISIPVKQLGGGKTEQKPTFEYNLCKSLVGMSEVDTPDLGTYFLARLHEVQMSCCSHLGRPRSRARPRLRSRHTAI